MNFRHQARHVEKVKTGNSSPRSGEEERKKISENLSYSLKHVIEKDISKNLSLIDTYMTFKCIIPPKAHQIAIENDFAPRMYASEILPLESGSIPNAIVLPYLPIKEFFNTYPNFLLTLTSTGRYIKYAENNGSIDRKSWVMGDFSNSIYKCDLVEVYSQLLNGTIVEYYKNPTEYNATMVWRVFATFKTIIDKYIISNLGEKNLREHVLQQVDSNYNDLVDAMKTRDISLHKAQYFKKKVQSTLPHVYYYIMYQAMLMDYTVLHKSNFIQCDMLLAGLLLMENLDEDGVKLSGIEESYLRILYERGINMFEMESFSEFLDQDELIKHLHEKTGRRFHSYLKYNTFLVEVYRRVLLDQDATLTRQRFVKVLENVQKYVSSLNGITLLSQIIAPSSESYMNDENIAEFIAKAATASNSSKKAAVLSTEMFTSNQSQLTTINTILLHNTERLEKSKKEIHLIDELLKQAQDSDNIINLIKGFQHSKGDHIGNIELSLKFKRQLVSFIKQDNPRSDTALAFLFKSIETEKAVILGKRKIIGSMIFYRKIGGHVEKFLASLVPNYAQLQGINILKKDKDFRNVHLYTEFELSSIKNSLKNKINNESESFTFRKFTSYQSEHMISQHQYMKQMMKTIKDECPICMEELELISLHGDIRHSICRQCKKAIVSLQKKCPFCRIPIYS